MNYTEVKRDIDATPSKIWSILTNAKLLQNSNLGILKLEGDIRPGNKINLVSEVSPQRAFDLRVSKFEPNKQMNWKGGMPFGLFTGNRRFVLSSVDGKTQLHIKEEFTGLLSGMIWKSMPDLTPSFEKLADGIKRLAEEPQQ